MVDRFFRLLSCNFFRQVLLHLTRDKSHWLKKLLYLDDGTDDDVNDRFSMGAVGSLHTWGLNQIHLHDSAFVDRRYSLASGRSVGRNLKKRTPFPLVNKL